MEWHIENFSCWNAKVHGQKISCPRVLSGLPSELHPWGLGGRLEARLLGGRAGDLFFLGPDGTPICSRLVSERGEVPPGPTFEEVVARIKKKIDYGDRLTLRFRCSDEDVREQHLRTVIDVFETSVEVDPKIFKRGIRQSVSCFDFPSSKKFKSFTLLYSFGRFELIPLIVKRYLFDSSKFLVRCCVHVLDREGSLVSYDVKERVYWDDTPGAISDAINMTNLVERRLTLLLKLKLIPGSVSRGFCHLPLIPVRVDIISDGPDNPLSNDLMFLFEGQEFSDFTLHCGGVSFPTHKAILGARSPVLRRMLLNDMKEAKEGEANIVDLDSNTLGLFLSFLYTGTVGDLRVDSALKLYNAADKYHVPSLKRECAKTLCADISVSNVCDVLLLAERHCDCQVASAARRFIANHYDEVFASDEWKSFEEHDPLLAVETSSKVCRGEPTAVKSIGFNHSLAYSLHPRQS